MSAKPLSHRFGSPSRSDRPVSKCRWNAVKEPSLCFDFREKHMERCRCLGVPASRDASADLRDYARCSLQGLIPRRGVSIKRRCDHALISSISCTISGDDCFVKVPDGVRKSAAVARRSSEQDVSPRDQRKGGCASVQCGQRSTDSRLRLSGPSNSSARRTARCCCSSPGTDSERRFPEGLEVTSLPD